VDTPWAVGRILAPTGEEAAEFDARAIDLFGTPESALMERAGSQAATWIHSCLPHLRGARTLVLAGSGNNGGDALILARCLSLWGWPLRVLHTGGDQADRSLLRGHPIDELKVADLSSPELAQILAEPELVVDGMLGTGAQGAPRGAVLQVIERLQSRIQLRSAASPAPVIVALDVPSGVDAASGATEGSAVRADVTLAFGWPKLGTLLHPGRARAGRLVAVEIGFPPPDPPFEFSVLTTGVVAPNLPRREAVTHKKQVGSLLVVAGSEGMAGAAILAGRAALRSGTGYLRIASAEANRSAVQAALPEAIWVDREDAAALAGALEASDAVAAGPGMGTDSGAAVALRRVLDGAPIPLVLDADALTLLRGGGSGEGSDHVELPTDRSIVLTPHPGEAGRLLGVPTSEIEADRRAALSRLRDRTGAVILLKGTPSLIAGTGRWLDPHGSSDLAAAGMGDVLTGVVGSLMAQRVDGEGAAGLALVLTGLAAQRAGMGAGLQSEDIPDHLPAVMADESGTPGLPSAVPPALPWVTFDLPAAR